MRKNIGTVGTQAEKPGIYGTFCMSAGVPLGTQARCRGTQGNGCQDRETMNRGLLCDCGFRCVEYCHSAKSGWNVMSRRSCSPCLKRGKCSAAVRPQSKREKRER